MTRLIQGTDGWLLDLAGTPVVQEIRDLFGETTLPLPLAPTCSRADALAFARGTEYGRMFGVQS